MKNDKKAMIQTVVLSVFLPFIFAFSVIYFLDVSVFYQSFELTVATGLADLTCAALYYFVVIRERKNDELMDSHNRRIKRSMLIQTGVSVGVFFLPLFIQVFFVPLENGHWSGEVVYILLFALIEPLVVHLAGMVFAIPKFVATTLEDWGLGGK